jgi:hypothetical protein
MSYLLVRLLGCMRAFKQLMLRLAALHHSRIQLLYISNLLLTLQVLDEEVQ